jgi:hypothetical protein
MAAITTAHAANGIDSAVGMSRRPLRRLERLGIGFLLRCANSRRHSAEVAALCRAWARGTKTKARRKVPASLN